MLTRVMLVSAVTAGKITDTLMRFDPTWSSHFLYCKLEITLRKSQKEKQCKPFLPMTTSTGSCPPVARCRGSCVISVSLWTRLFILDRVKQLGNVLLSGLIHLDHRPLHTDMERGKFSHNLAVSLIKCDTGAWVEAMFSCF